MGKSLEGRTALVTGSTSGIGRGIAELYAAEGANVVLNGFGEPGAIEELRAKLARHGVKAGYDAADMSRAADIEAMMSRIGDIDILVNNAGIQFVSPVDEFPPERWDAIIAINLTSAIIKYHEPVPPWPPA